MSGVTREDRIRNEYIRGSIGVAPIVDKRPKNRLRWLGVRTCFKKRKN